MLHAACAIRLEDGHMDDNSHSHEDGIRQFHERRLSAFKMFHKLEIYEGQADIYFTWAIALSLNAGTPYELKMKSMQAGSDH